MCPASLICFNPRLPLPGGDATFGAQSPDGLPGFNPRLPLPGGDAKVCPSAGGHSPVSIHASRCREAMPYEARSLLAFPVFQSTPPVAGRRCLLLFFLHSYRLMFQSTPPVAGRRCAVVSLRNMSPSSFQSTPPVAGRRCLGGIQKDQPSCCFNPRLPLPGGDA